MEDSSSIKIPSEFVEWSNWSWDQILLFWAVHLIAVEILQHAIVMNVELIETRKIEMKGKHLDELSGKDKAFIVFNRMTVPFLTYFVAQFAWKNPSHVEWDFHKLNPFNTIGSLVAFFLIYDFVYVLFHRLLHVRGEFSAVRFFSK